MKYILKDQKRIMPQTKQTFTILTTFGVFDILDLKDYEPENKRSFRYLLVINDIFSNFGWTVPPKNKNG